MLRRLPLTIYTPNTSILTYKIQQLSESSPMVVPLVECSYGPGHGRPVVHVAHWLLRQCFEGHLDEPGWWVHPVETCSMLNAGKKKAVDLVSRGEIRDITFPYYTLR